MRDLDHPRVATLAKDNSGATLAAAAAARAAAEELARTGGTVTAADVQERVDRYRLLLLDALGAGGVCSGFLSVPYRPPGSRGPAARLLYDPARVDPAVWLTERLGEVTILSASEPVAAEEFTLAAEDEERGVGLEPPPAPNPAPEAHPADVRCCRWIVDTSGETFRWCGEHRRQYAGTLGAAAIARDWLPPLNSVANSDGGVDWFLLLDATASATLTNGPGQLIPLGRVSIDEAFIAVGLGLPANMKRAVA